MLNVYVGYDSREKEAFEVCKASLEKYSDHVSVVALEHRHLRNFVGFNREWKIKQDGSFEDIRDGKPFSTEFAFTRFLIPHIQDKGWALFCDSDMLFKGNITNLFNLANPEYAVMVVKHNYHPTESIKMDGMMQQNYSRKNWSSLILWNCDHPANKRLTVDHINYMPGNWLHNFKWLDDDEIGSLPEEWNWLEGHSSSDIDPQNIHYTRGGPWFKNYQDVQYAKDWLIEYAQLNLR